MTSRVRLGLAGLIAIAAVASCIDLGGPAPGVASISSLRVPSPAVVIGDILRDSLGVATPVGIDVFDGAGNTLPSEKVTYFALDTTVTVDSNGFVHGITRDTVGGRVAAGAGELQTLPQRIFVTVQPETATKGADATEVDFTLGVLDTTKASNWSGPMVVTLGNASGVAPQGFVVSYTITRSPAPRSGTLPTAYVGDDVAKTTARDTTDRTGVASRRVVIRQSLLGDAILAGTAVDTVVVHAVVKYLGVDVPGSPMDFIVPVQRKP